MRERVEMKSPVLENCTPGSVRGAPGNRCPYRDSERQRGSGNVQTPGQAESLSYPAAASPGYRFRKPLSSIQS